MLIGDAAEPDEATAERRLVFARIAVWHCERAALKYQNAAAKFLVAAAQQRTTIIRERFGENAAEMSRRARAAEAALKTPQDFLDQNAK